jgi:RimJ/RimL family protein N-acetyltransferase
VDDGTHRLVPLSVEHLAAAQRMVEDPAVRRFTRVPDPPPPDFAQTWYAAYERGRDDGSREAFAIVDADGGFLGLALAPSIDRAARTAELGYVVAPEARGRGVATAGLRLLTEWAFRELGAERLELLISVENPASKRVARHCGYTYEGTLRSVHVREGLRENTEIWSRLPGDRG